MNVKMVWANSGQFIIEDTDAFFLEASADEVKNIIYPKLCKREQIKFDEMKDRYVATKDGAVTKTGFFYFWVSGDVEEIKFESAAFPESENAKKARGLKKITEIAVQNLEDIPSLVLPG